VTETSAPAGPRLRNDEHGYGLVTKSLHWLVAGAIALQFIIGYVMDPGGGGRGRGRGRGGESGQGRGRGGDEGYDIFGDDALVSAHVVLGATILTLATIRLVWRRTTPLPPWAPGLSPFERTLATWTERALYVAMFAVPLTGLVLVLSGDDAVLPLHIAAHIVFFVAFAFHIGLVLKHQFVDRDHLVRRML
jgi:cytochrome b561